MKKFMLILVVLTVVLASCASPVDEVEEPVVVNPFEGRWIHPDSGYIFEYRGNTIVRSSGYNSHYEYDDTYYYEYGTGNMSHIYISYEYEFRDNGNELYLTWIPNLYGTIPGDKFPFYRKIGD